MERIGFTCGAFDLFHSGHVLFLKDCKKECDYLVVGIQIDPSLERKEKNKPVQSILERQLEVRSCRYVDEVIIYETEKDLEIILANLDFDIRFLGDDYLDGKKSITGEDLVEIKYIDRKHPWSSSKLRKRVKES